jgi:predicted nucleic acid-binding protein
VIIADTNVWSAAVKVAPDPAAMSWMVENRDELAITTVSIGELLFGVELMPPGRRRDTLAAAVDALIANAQRRIFPYDVAAARELSRIRAECRRRGREVVKPEDAMIAAIAAARGCSVATRNGDDFDDMGVEIIDPWKHGR